MHFSRVILGLGAGVVAVGASLAGCGDDEPASTTGGSGDCKPPPECPYAAGDCLAFTDNAGQTKFTLRMSQLTVTQPQPLATGTVKDIVSRGVRAKLPECNLENGDGTFNWLLEFDTTTGKLRTGGARPVPDIDKGYCFTDETVMQNGKSFVIQPIVLNAPIQGGKFAASETKDVIVPIYLDALDTTKVVFLPLHGARLYDGVISADYNCIGKYNAEGLDPVNLCLDEEGIPAFLDGGSLEGFITLEDADTVVIDLLNESMCVLLSGDANTFSDKAMPIAHCKRGTDNAITLTGDWCAATNAPAAGDCKDSFKLGAKFSASAAKTAASCP